MSAAVENRRRWLMSFVGLSTGEAGSSVLRLLATVWIAARLGPEHFGLISLGLAAASYLGVLSQAGLDVVATREVAADREVAIRYLGRVTGLRVMLSFGVYALFGIVVVVTPLDGTLRWVLLGMSLLVFTQALDVRWSFVAEQRTGWAAGSAITGAGVLLLGFVAFVRGPSSLAPVVVVTLVGDLVTQLMMLMASRRTYGRWRPTRPAGLTRRLLRAGVPLAVSRAARTLIITVDVFFVGFFRPAADVGHYALAGRLVAVGITYLGLYQYTYIATMAKVVGDAERVHALVASARRLVWRLGPPALVVLMLAVQVAVPRLFGEGYRDSVRLVQVMLPALLLLAFTGVWTAVLVSYHRYTTVAKVAAAAGTVNVVANLALLPTVGTVGASMATVAAEAVQLVFTRREAKKVLASLPPRPPPAEAAAPAEAAVAWLGDPVSAAVADPVVPVTRADHRAVRTGAPRSVLVTGGAGFLGRAIVQTLEAGGAEVVALDRVGGQQGDHPIVQADIRDLDALRANLDNVDAVVHAAFAPPRVSPEELAEVNVTALARLAELAEGAGVRRLVVVSSTIVERRPRRHPLSARLPLSRLDEYRRTRSEAERLLLERPGPLEVAIVRPCTFVGPGRVGAFALIFEAIRTGGVVPILGRGDNRYQLLHVDDLARGIAELSRSSATGVFHFGGDAPTTTADQLERLADHSGTNAKVVRIPPAAARLAVRGLELAGLPPLSDWHVASARGEDRIVDNSRAISELGWHPRFSSESALFDAYDWYASVTAAGEVAATTHPVPTSHRMIARALSFARRAGGSGVAT